MMGRYDMGQWIQADMNPGGVRLGGRACRRCLCDTEAVGAVVGYDEPRQHRDCQPFFRAAMTAVPEAVQAIGLLPTFGDKTGIDHEGLCRLRRNHRSDRHLVERDKVKVSGVPTGTGSLVILAVAAQV